VAALRDRVEIYLQYDGQGAATQEYLRGQDLSELKARVVEALSAQRLFTTLVMTVSERNEHQIGEVLDTAFSTPYIGGVAFQPLFASGRSPVVDSMRRVTTTGVLRRIERQTQGRLRARDLIALPCSHPDCCSIGYFLKAKDGTFRGLAAIVGEDELKRSLTVVGNSIAFGESLAHVKDALMGVMSESMTLSRPELVQHLQRICTSCDIGGFGQLLQLAFRPGATADFVAQRVKRVTVKHFMDADMLITERLEQCCVHVAGAGEEPVRMPFCAARLFPKVRARVTQNGATRAELGAGRG
jgi:uncharacterized radical SAM superfamily Fe-S cluster-containing enzyme